MPETLQPSLTRGNVCGSTSKRKESGQRNLLQNLTKPLRNLANIRSRDFLEVKVVVSLEAGTLVGSDLPADDFLRKVDDSVRKDLVIVGANLADHRPKGDFNEETQGNPPEDGIFLDVVARR